MKILYLLYLLVILFVLYTFIQPVQDITKEKFINSNYTRQKLPYKVKEDVYMNFLGDLNDSFGTHLKDASKDSTSPIRQKALCDDSVRKEVQSKALNEAFDKVQEKDIDKDSKLFDINIPQISQITFKVDNNRTCANKASQLCDLTDPMLYMSQNTRFPPKWIGPYKNVLLPKHTDLKCWSNMINCCKNNL
jgi:hypothetical protein